MKILLNYAITWTSSAISAETSPYPCRVRALNEEADGRSRAETPRRKRRRHRPPAGS